MRQKMSNKDIQEFLNTVYNKWFCKWRDNLPKTDAGKDWIPITDEAIALIEKYQRFDDADFSPCATIIQMFSNILYDRTK